MKIKYLFLLVITSQHQLSEAAGTWGLVKGSAAGNAIGNYGTMGVQATSNVPPAKYDCGFWTDTAFNFWIYSGNTYNKTWPGDMWRYKPVGNQWTWMHGGDNGVNLTVAVAKGVFDSLNSPGYVESPITWVDSGNRLWMYSLSDLWVYDITINQWAWMGGAQGANAAPVYGTKGVGTASTRPGSRYQTQAAWVKNNQLFFFGGCTNSIAYLHYNDIWRYDIATGIWTWMAGSSVPNNHGVYGIKGVASVNNMPWSRSVNSMWRDAAGDVWIFGGTNEFNASGGFDDVWKLNPTTFAWTWVHGNQMSTGWTGWTNGFCTSGSGTNPERSVDNACWKLCDNLFLIYGGHAGYAENIFDDHLFWYSTSQDIWGLTGYAGNVFPRIRSAYFVNRRGFPFLFGGVGDYYTASYNSLYSYVPDDNCIPMDDCPVPPFQATVQVTNPVCVDTCRATAIVAIANGQAPYTYQWSDTGLVGGVRTDLCVGTYYVTVTDAQSNVVIDTFEIIAPPPLVVNLSIATDSICASDSVLICAPSGLSLYSWNTGEIGMCIYVNQAGSYYLTVTDHDNCTVESNHLSIHTFPATSVSLSVNGDTLSVYGAVTQQWYLNDNPIINATSNTYIATQSGSYTVAVTDSNGCAAISSAVIISDIDNVTEYDEVNVYPNPSQSSWQLTVGNNFIGGMAEVFAADGRVVFKSAITNPQSVIAPQVAKGVYLLRISSSKNNVVRKLIKL